MLHNYHLLTMDLSMFGDGAGDSAPAAGEAPDVPAAAAAPAAQPVSRQAQQPGQTAAPQQTQTPTSEAHADKGRAFRDLIRGEYREQYADETQKLINRRFRETDARIRAMQPVIDLLDARYGTRGDMAMLLRAVGGGDARRQADGGDADIPAPQDREARAPAPQDREAQAVRQAQRQHLLAQRQLRRWEAEAEALKAEYPDFELADAQTDDLFRLMLRSRYPMERAYRAAYADRLAAQAAASAEKAVADNIRARGARPAEAGANAAAPYALKEDVSKLTDREVLQILSRISNGGRVTFG